MIIIEHVPSIYEDLNNCLLSRDYNLDRLTNLKNQMKHNIYPHLIIDHNHEKGAGF